MLAATGGKGVDVVDQLVGQPLHRLLAGPRYMRGEDEVGVLQRLHQGMVGGRRFDACHIETGTAEAAVGQRPQQRLLIHQTATADVDQQGARFHQIQLPLANQVAGVGGERAVQADHIRALQQLVERQAILVMAATDLALGVTYRHPHSLGPLAERLTQGSLADDAKLLAVQIHDVVIEEAELAALLPAPLQQRLAPAEEVARQGQHQCHGVFRHRGARVVADVAYPDVGGAARLQIHVVAAGSGERDEFEFRQLGQLGGADAHLVDDGDAGIFQPLDHLFRGRAGITLPVVGKVGMMQGDARIQGIAVEKHNLLHVPSCHIRV